MKNNFFLFVFTGLFLSGFSQSEYNWLNKKSEIEINSIACPTACQRVSVKKSSFSEWLRNFPMNEKFKPVLLYNGEAKNRQDVHYKVLDIDVGKENLQQCADAVIRMRAEYLYANKHYDSISFTFTNGFKADWNQWRNGYRIIVNNNKCKWQKSAAVDDSYSTFRKYLKTIFTYCGTYSLSKELHSTNSPPIPGMIYIQAGFPGHAVMIMDVCQNMQNGKYYVLLAQSYMPAQEIHLLKNFNSLSDSPWFLWNKDGSIQTPEWNFPPGSQKKFNH